MEWKRFIPLLIAIPLLVGLVVYGQGRIASDPLKTQIPGGANSLDQIGRFQLALELDDETQVEMDYEKPGNEEMFASVRRATADGNVDRVEGDPAFKQIQNLVQNIPSLTESETLTLIQAVLDQEKIAPEKLRNFELRYELKNGTQKMITLQQEEEQPEKAAPEQNQQTSQRTPAPQQPAPQQTPPKQQPRPPSQQQIPQQQPQPQEPEQPAPEEEPSGEQPMPENEQGRRNTENNNNNNDNDDDDNNDNNG